MWCEVCSQTGSSHTISYITWQLKHNTSQHNTTQNSSYWSPDVSFHANSEICLSLSPDTHVGNTQVIWHDHKWVTVLISVFKQRFKPWNRKLPSPAWSYLLEDLVQKTSAVSRHSFSSQFQSLIHTHCSRCALNRCTEVSVCYLGKGQSFKQRHSRPGLHPECYLSYTLTNLQRDTRKCRTTVFIQKDLQFKPAVRLMKHPVTQQYQSIEQVKFVFQTLDV